MCITVHNVLGQEEEKWHIFLAIDFNERVQTGIAPLVRKPQAVISFWSLLLFLPTQNESSFFNKDHGKTMGRVGDEVNTS